MVQNERDLDYRKILQREFEAKKIKNPSYNLSSFARLLDLPPSRLSEILRAKVGLSKTKANLIAAKLKLSEKETELFIDLVSIEHARNPSEKAAAKKRIEIYISKEFYLYNENHLSYLSEWYHHALIEFINLFPGKTKHEMSESLGLDMGTISIAIKQLILLEIITKAHKGYKVIHANRTSAPDVPSEAIKKLNKQILQKASDEVTKQSVDNRDYSILFLSFKKSQMKLAKARIKEFKRSFMKEFESSSENDSIYTLGIQLFELTGNEKRK